MECCAFVEEIIFHVYSISFIFQKAPFINITPYSQLYDGLFGETLNIKIILYTSQTIIKQLVNYIKIRKDVFWFRLVSEIIKFCETLA